MNFLISKQKKALSVHKVGSLIINFFYYWKWEGKIH